MQPQPNTVLSLIVAMTPDRVIGRDNNLPWRLPSDMRRFKDITNGHPVIMGRKTWESIPDKFRPLPGRTNIVVTRKPRYQTGNALVVNSLLEAKIVAMHSLGSEEFFVIGGGELYREAIHFAQRLYVTKVHAAIDGDAFFPELNGEWKCTNALKTWRWLKDDDFETSFHFYERISS
jgi:dihydrofolate reductase